jgi:hypothetical protein
MLPPVFLNKQSIYIVLFILICYLLIGSGIHSDDITTIYGVQEKSFSNIIFPDLGKIHVIVFGLPSYYLDYLQYYFFGFNGFYYDAVKVIITLVSFVLIYKFFLQYIEQWKAFVLTFLFVFFITHDGVNYWMIALPYLLTPAIILYSHMLINQNNYYKGFGFGLLGSFMSFASPPYAIGLSLIFLLKKEWRKFLFFITPQLLYIGYYFFISNYLQLSKGRIEHSLSFSSLFKQYMLQLGTFLDTFIGPSFWLKIYYSFTQITLISIIIGITLIILFYKYFKPTKEKIDISLVISLVFVTLLAFGMFALTGYYPQIAFNLGNRVTIYASLLVSFLIVMLLMNNKKIATVIFGIFLFSILGISDHWKSWNQNQLTVIENISKNQDLKNFDISNQLFVIGNQYSKFGEIAHIEFFTQPEVPSTIFKVATNRSFKVSSLNERFYYKDGKLVDKKYGTNFKVESDTYIYDSSLDKLYVINENEISSFVKNLDSDKRHWIQLLNKESFIIQLVIKLMPRMVYLFEN